MDFIYWKKKKKRIFQIIYIFFLCLDLHGLDQFLIHVMGIDSLISLALNCPCRNLQVHKYLWTKYKILPGKTGEASQPGNTQLEYATALYLPTVYIHYNKDFNPHDPQQFLFILLWVVQYVQYVI